MTQLYCKHKSQNCSNRTTQTDKEFCMTQHCSTESITSVPQGLEAATQNFHCEDWTDDWWTWFQNTSCICTRKVQAIWVTVHSVWLSFLQSSERNKFW